MVASALAEGEKPAPSALMAPASPAEVRPPAPAPCPDPGRLVSGPILSEGPAPPQLPPGQPEASDKPLPINLATALRLAGARPVVISAAESAVDTAAAALARAKVAWLPTAFIGAGYYRHDGGTQGQSGNFYDNTKEQFLAGGGAKAFVSLSDAFFAPLAARQVLRSREFDVQTARNDALLAVAEAYFNVQQARGRLASAQDVVTKSQDLAAKVRAVGEESIRATDIHRARAQLAEFEVVVAAAREEWRSASADLARVLRLDPAAVALPIEPPHLRVTLIPPHEPVDALIPIGLTNRPELASQQTLVQAALTRIRQERLRPLVPSIVLDGGTGSVSSGGYLMGGAFGSGVDTQGNPWAGRIDVNVQLLWALDNLGFGNRAQVRLRRAEQQQLLVELFRIQDLVAAEIVRAHAQVESAAARVIITERDVAEAQLAYEGSLAEVGKVMRVGNVQVLVRRAFEVVDALRALARAYEAYFTSINDFNRAQFRLYRALGYPATMLTCERLPGTAEAVVPNHPSPKAPDQGASAGPPQR
jgi:outer membrane protein TolC